MLHSEIGLTPKHGTLTGHTKVHLSSAPFTRKYAVALEWSCLQRKRRCQERCRGNNARCSLSQRDVADQRKFHQLLCCIGVVDYTMRQSEVSCVLKTSYLRSPSHETDTQDSHQAGRAKQRADGGRHLAAAEGSNARLACSRVDDKKSQKCALSCFRQAAKHYCSPSLDTLVVIVWRRTVSSTSTSPIHGSTLQAYRR